MKKIFFISLALAVVAIAVVTIARSNRTSPVESKAKPLSNPPRSSAADRRLQKAETIIRVSPSKAEGYNLLASAFMQKARETGDFAFNEKADAAIGRSLEIATENIDALNLQASLLVSRHRFRDALAVARRAQQIAPDSADVYVAMTDALVEMGDYRGALDAAQKLMDLRPDSVSYARASHLRALHGDTEGAIEAMKVAVRAVSNQDAESLAWYRTHLASQLINAGRIEEAEREIDIALAIFPGYYIALAAKGRARVIAGDINAAVEYYSASQARVPLSSTAIALGDLYAKLGQSYEAKRQYDLAEATERAGSGTPSQQLAMLWVERGERHDEALEAMRKERGARADIYTCDALAWTLFRIGNLDEAKQLMEEALRLGSRDARLHYHAGMIYHAAGDRRRAFKHLRLALEAKSSFDGGYFSFSVLEMENAKRILEADD